MAQQHPHLREPLFDMLRRMLSRIYAPVLSASASVAHHKRIEPAVQIVADSSIHKAVT